MPEEQLAEDYSENEILVSADELIHDHDHDHKVHESHAKHEHDHHENHKIELKSEDHICGADCPEHGHHDHDHDHDHKVHESHAKHEHDQIAAYDIRKLQDMIEAQRIDDLVGAEYSDHAYAAEIGDPSISSEVSSSEGKTVDDNNIVAEASKVSMDLEQASTIGEQSEIESEIAPLSQQIVGPLDSYLGQKEDSFSESAESVNERALLDVAKKELDEEGVEIDLESKVDDSPNEFAVALEQILQLDNQGDLEQSSGEVIDSPPPSESNVSHTELDTPETMKSSEFKLLSDNSIKELKSLGLPEDSLADLLGYTDENEAKLEPKLLLEIVSERLSLLPKESYDLVIKELSDFFDKFDIENLTQEQIVTVHAQIISILNSLGISDALPVLRAALTSDGEEVLREMFAHTKELALSASFKVVKKEESNDIIAKIGAALVKILSNRPEFAHV